MLVEGFEEDHPATEPGDAEQVEPDVIKGDCQSDQKEDPREY